MTHQRNHIRIVGAVLLLALALSACQARPQPAFSLQVTPGGQGSEIGFTFLACPLGALPGRYTMALSMWQLNGDSIGETAQLISQDYTHYYDDIYVVPDSLWHDAPDKGVGCRQASLPAVLQADVPDSACPAKYMDFKLVVTTFDEHGTPRTSQPSLPVWDCQPQG